MNMDKNLFSTQDDCKRRVRILLRVSSDQQLEADGDLTVQRQLVLDYIKNHSDWILDEKEYFEGSNSGYKNSVAERTILQEAYQDAKNREYDILVVYKDDRIGRRMWEIGSYIMSLKSLGVDIYTVKDGCISPEGNDIMGQMMLALRYGNAQKSSADTGMRVKDTAKKLVMQGKFMGGKAPYGYTLELSGEISKHGRALKRLVIHPEQAEAVKYIYELSFSKEYGSVKIANTLNAEHRYRKLAPKDFWKSGTITSILTNPIYAGYISYNRREGLNGRHHSLNKNEWILSQKANPELVIINEDTWIQVQKKREKRCHKYMKSLENQKTTVIKRNDGMLFLVDVLHCGYCSCKMVNGSKYNYWTIKSTGECKTSKTAIYKCQTAWQGVPHEQTKQFRADKIEPIVSEILAEYIQKLQENEDIQKQIAENSRKQREKIKRDLEAAQRELKKLKNGICIMEEHIPDAMMGEYPLKLEDLIRNINIQKEKEKKQIAIVQEKENENFCAAKRNWKDINIVPTWREIFLYADTPAKRVLTNKLIERIDITKEKMVIRFKIGLDNIFSDS